MSLNPGDVKIVPPVQETTGYVGGQAVPTYRVYFTVRGGGPYFVELAREGYAPEKAQRKIQEKAEMMVATLDLFK